MRRILQLLAVATILGATALWIALGANSGWTKTSVAVKTVDQVTGIEGIGYQSRFVPGVDFLAGMLLGAGLLGGVSLFFRRKREVK